MTGVLEFLVGPFGKSLWFAFAVGVTVSIDVFCLVLSQHQDFAIDSEDGNSAKDPKLQASTHARTHAILFFAYMLGITYIAKIFQWVMGALSGLGQWLVRKFAELYQIELSIDFDQATFDRSVILVIGLAIFVIVWQTYFEKVVENHSEKISDKENPLKDQRWDVRGVYKAIKYFGIVKGERLLDYALALAVAVDMLAISSVIRVYFDGTLDTGYDGFHFDLYGSLRGSHLTDGCIWWLNVASFTIVIFWVVYGIARFSCFIAGKLSNKLRDGVEPQTNHAGAEGVKPSGWKKMFLPLLVGLRVFEPFLMFLILANALFHLVAYPEHAPPDGVLRWAWIVLSIVLIVCLIMAQGCGRIVSAVRGGLNFTASSVPLKASGQGPPASDGFGNGPAKESAKQLETSYADPNTVISVPNLIWKTICAYGHVPFIVGAILYFLALYAASHAVKGEEPLLLFANLFAISVGVLTAAVLFCPFPAPDLEAHIDARYFFGKRDKLAEQNKFYWSLLASFFAILGFFHFCFEFYQPTVFAAPQPFITAIGLLLLFVIGAWLLAYYRGWRNRKCIVFTKNREHFKDYAPNFGDFLSSIGFASLLWQTVLLASYFLKG